LGTELGLELVLELGLGFASHLGVATAECGDVVMDYQLPVVDI